MKNVHHVSNEPAGLDRTMLTSVLSPVFCFGLGAGSAWLLTSPDSLIRLGVGIYLTAHIAAAILLAPRDDAKLKTANRRDSSFGPALLRTGLSFLFHVLPALISLCLVGQLALKVARSLGWPLNVFLVALSRGESLLASTCLLSSFLFAAATTIYLVTERWSKHRPRFDSLSRVWSQVDTVVVWPRR